MITREGHKPPQVLYIGMTRGQWPVRFFYGDDAEEQALGWLEGAQGTAEVRTVYKGSLKLDSKLEYVPPVPASGKLVDIEVSQT